MKSTMYKGDIKQFSNWFMDAIELIAFSEYNQMVVNNPKWQLEELPSDTSKQLGFDDAVARETYFSTVNSNAPTNPVVNVGLLNTCFSMALITLRELNPKLYKQAVKHLADGKERLLPVLCMRIDANTTPLIDLTKSEGLEDVAKH